MGLFAHLQPLYNADRALVLCIQSRENPVIAQVRKAEIDHGTHRFRGVTFAPISRVEDITDLRLQRLRAGDLQKNFTEERDIVAARYRQPQNIAVLAERGREDGIELRPQRIAAWRVCIEKPIDLRTAVIIGIGAEIGRYETAKNKALGFYRQWNGGDHASPWSMVRAKQCTGFAITTCDKNKLKFKAPAERSRPALKR